MFEWKELLKRFHYAQYDERKLIRDLQLQVEDLNANLKRIALQFGSDDERITALEDGGDPVDAYTKTETDALLAPKISLSEARRILTTDAPVTISTNWNDPADRQPGVSEKLYTANGTGGPIPGAIPANYYRMRISSTTAYASVEFAIPSSADLPSFRRIEIGGFYSDWIKDFDGSRWRFYADRGGTGDVAVDTVYKPARVIVNYGGVFSTATGRFTCPTAGEYRVGFKGLGGNPTGSKAGWHALRKNGTIVSHSFSTFTGYSMQHLTYHGLCAAGDYFDVITGGSYSQYIDLSTTQFNAFWGEMVA